MYIYKLGVYKFLIRVSVSCAIPENCLSEAYHTLTLYGTIGFNCVAIISNCFSFLNAHSNYSETKVTFENVPNLNTHF